MDTTNYGKYHDREKYLLNEVQPRFRQTQRLSTFDFFFIIIWKANRAKTNIARKILKKGHKSLGKAVRALISAIAASPSDKERLRVLIEDWKFALPMASAILTMLYPKNFTIYDVRVCEILGNFKKTKNKTNFESIWKEYSKYVRAVKKAVPQVVSLRKKDRFLWGKSFARDLRQDIASGFTKKTKKTKRSKKAKKAKKK